MAVASAVLDVIEQKDLRSHAAQVGKVLMEGLQDLKLKYSFIGDIRGAGLFIGIDLVKSPETKEPSSDIAEYVVKRLKDEKIIMSTEGKYGNVLKIKPPMTFDSENAKYLLSKLHDIFSEVKKYLASHSTSSSSAAWDDEDEEGSITDSSDSFAASSS